MKFRMIRSVSRPLGFVRGFSVSFEGSPSRGLSVSRAHCIGSSGACRMIRSFSRALRLEGSSLRSRALRLVRGFFISRAHRIGSSGSCRMIRFLSSAHSLSKGQIFRFGPDYPDTTEKARINFRIIRLARFQSITASF